jgi:tetratricopeptide (TPR) repeat protein
MADGAGENEVKRIPIRARGLDLERERRAAGGEDAPRREEAPETHLDLVKKKLLKQSGVKFQTRRRPKADAEGLWGEGTPVPVESLSSDESPSSDATHRAGDTPASTEPAIEGENPESDRRRRAEKSTKRSRRLVPREEFAILKRRVRRYWNIRVILGPVVVVAILMAFVIWQVASLHGIAEGERRLRAARTKDLLQVPAEFTKSVDDALITLRSGDPKKALDTLRQLESQRPDVASMTYLVAEAAMRSGNIDLADSKAAESIAKEERICESLSLKAGIVAMRRATPGYKTMGDPRLSAELLLRQAILADAANPIPYVRLGILLRYQNKTEEAEQMLHAAKARLNPVESPVMMDSTTSLIKLAKTPDTELPALTPDSGKSPAALIGSAYAAMRRSDFQRASESLRLCQGMIPADLFALVMMDPALRPYRSQPLLAEFFKPHSGQ